MQCHVSNIRPVLLFNLRVSLLHCLCRIFVFPLCKKKGKMYVLITLTRGYSLQAMQLIPLSLKAWAYW